MATDKPAPYSLPDTGPSYRALALDGCTCPDACTDTKNVSSFSPAPPTSQLRSPVHD